MVKKIKYKIANIQLSKIVSLLGKILGIVVKEQEGVKLYNKIEQIRSLKAWLLLSSARKELRKQILNIKKLLMMQNKKHQM